MKARSFRRSRRKGRRKGDKRKWDKYRAIRRRLWFNENPSIWKSGCSVPVETRHNLTRPLAKGGRYITRPPFHSFHSGDLAPSSLIPPRPIRSSLLSSSDSRVLSPRVTLFLSQYRTVRLRRTMRRIQFYTRTV